MPRTPFITETRPREPLPPYDDSRTHFDSCPPYDPSCSPDMAPRDVYPDALFQRGPLPTYIHNSTFSILRLAGIPHANHYTTYVSGYQVPVIPGNVLSAQFDFWGNIPIRKQLSEVWNVQRSLEPFVIAPPGTLLPDHSGDYTQPLRDPHLIDGTLQINPHHLITLPKNCPVNRYRHFYITPDPPPNHFFVLRTPWHCPFSPNHAYNRVYARELLGILPDETITWRGDPFDLRPAAYTVTEQDVPNPKTGLPLYITSKTQRRSRMKQDGTLVKYEYTYYSPRIPLPKGGSMDGPSCKTIEQALINRNKMLTHLDLPIPEPVPCP